MTKIITEEDISDAAECLKKGGTVVFPTETVYGLGADAFNDAAIDKIYKAKGRPADNPLIVHIADINSLHALTDKVSEDCRKLMDKFWPGPLTIIFPKSDKVHMRVTAGLDTVAVRFPSNPIAQRLIKESGVFVAAPSANLSGSPSPTVARHVIDDLDGRVDYIITGCDCDIGLESTVIDMTGDIPNILRPGAITLEMIKDIFSNATEDRCTFSDVEKPKCPGMKYKHYAPKAEVQVVIGNKENTHRYIENQLIKHKNSGVMTYKGGDYSDAACVLSAGNNMNEYAAKLFYNLRVFDEYKVEKVFAEFAEEDGIGTAVRNRLYKSAGNNVIEV